VGGEGGGGEGRGEDVLVLGEGGEGHSGFEAL
jgi:hypothetical protein